ncbi:hypothetical protein FWC31_01245 [Candidatus Saccharibacteria bacterium]|nr:hypothetical protein [Candidatus Saccharibacteria bacterium]
MAIPDNIRFTVAMRHFEDGGNLHDFRDDRKRWNERSTTDSYKEKVNALITLATQHLCKAIVIVDSGQGDSPGTAEVLNYLINEQSESDIESTHFSNIERGDDNEWRKKDPKLNEALYWGRVDDKFKEELYSKIIAYAIEQLGQEASENLGVFFVGHCDMANDDGFYDGQIWKLMSDRNEHGEDFRPGKLQNGKGMSYDVRADKFEDF